MAWDPIALTVPQYEDNDGNPYSGAVLKFYESGTTTNISAATDGTGATTVSSIALNASGFPEVSGNVIIPHIDQDYKIALYPTQAAADADSGGDLDDRRNLDRRGHGGMAGVRRHPDVFEHDHVHPVGRPDDRIPPRTTAPAHGLGRHGLRHDHRVQLLGSDNHGHGIRRRRGS